jgi:hypothetical protein
LLPRVYGKEGVDVSERRRSMPFFYSNAETSSLSYIDVEPKFFKIVSKDRKVPARFSCFGRPYRECFKDLRDFLFPVVDKGQVVVNTNHIRLVLNGPLPGSRRRDGLYYLYLTELYLMSNLLSMS